MFYITYSNVKRLIHISQPEKNEKKAISNAYLIPPALVMVNKNNDVRIQSACNVVAKYQIVSS